MARVSVVQRKVVDCWRVPCFNGTAKARPAEAAKAFGARAAYHKERWKSDWVEDFAKHTDLCHNIRLLYMTICLIGV